MKLVKRTLHLLVSATLVLSGTISIAADETQDVSPTLSQESYLDHLKSENEPIERGDDLNYEDNDIVNVIVELTEKPLLDYYATGSVETFMKSSRAATVETKIEIAQDSTIQKIAAITGDATVENRYSTVLNGFSIKTEYKNIKEIRKISNVKRAFVAATYEAVEPQMSSSNEMVGAPEVWDSAHYKGEGIVVGVLDTGLDLQHEAFQQELTDVGVDYAGIATIVANTELSAKTTTPGLSVDDVYAGTKVPYAYDYADRDADVTPKDAETGHNTAHGTHVAGTVAGKSDTFSGVAPNAQLMIFKVFSDIGGTTHDGIVLAALDDAAKLNVDVINMSLGSDAGFSSEGEGLTQEVYDRVKAAGIILDVSAGNATNSAKNNKWAGLDLTPTGDPDHGLVGRPSTFNTPLSIASVDNTTKMLSAIASNGKTIAHTTTEVSFKSIEDKVYNYVVIPGVGSASDYTGLDVNGTIALVRRGDIAFSDKISIAESQGAVGILVYDNVVGSLINMAAGDAQIPAGFISKEDGEFLAAQATKEMTIFQTDVPIENNATGGQPSSFSSMGTTNELRIKPELAAPGGNIYSTYPSQTGTYYSSMSGTSMASPHVAGASALVKQHLKNTMPTLSDNEMVERVNQLLMSTAHPSYGADGPNSVRVQGAGVFNVNDAINSPAFLSVAENKDGSQRPKLELGDDPQKTGVYTLNFSVTNTSDTTVDYDISGIASRPGSVTYGFQGIGPRSFMLDRNVTADASVNGDATVSVAPQETKNVSVTVTLSASEKAAMDAAFENGIYVEGYVTLTPTSVSGNDVILSIPYLAYYGNWEQPGIFDHGSWYDDIPLPNSYVNQVYTKYSILGGNIIDQDFVDVNKDMFAISPNGDGIADSIETVILSQVRNARVLNYTITNKETQEKVYEFTSEFSNKSMYRNAYGQQIPSSAFDPAPEWKGDKLNGETVEDGVYRYAVDAELGFRPGVNDTYEFDVIVDTKNPILDTNNFKLVRRNGRTFIETKAIDENYMVNTLVAPFIDGQPKWDTPIFQKYTPNEAVREHDLSIDVTDYIGEEIMISLIDVGMNEQVYALTVPSENLTDLKLSPASATLAVGEQLEIEVENLGANATVSWTSSNPGVAAVDQNGVASAIAEGQTTLKVEDDKGNTATMTLGVYAKPNVSGMTLSFENVEVNSGTSGQISVSAFEPLGVSIDDSNITWSSSDATIVALTNTTGRTASFVVNGSVGESATLSATYGEVSAEATVTIVATDGALTTTVEYTSMSIHRDSFVTLDATDITNAAIAWTVDDEAIVSLEDMGDGTVRAKGLAPGNTIVRATSENGSIHFNIAVLDTDNKYTEVNFDALSYGLSVGASQTVTLDFGTTTSLLEDNHLTHRSYDETIATYDGTTIVAKKVGSVIIETVLENGQRATALVQVTALNKSALVTLVAQTATLQESSYTEASWTALQTAITSAKAVIANENASQAEIDAAVLALQTAIDGLKSKITGLQPTMALTVGTSVTLNPTPGNGTWTYDEAFFTMTEPLARANQGKTFTALKAGTTTLTYTVNGQSFEITVEIAAKGIDPNPNPNPNPNPGEKPNPQVPNEGNKGEQLPITGIESRNPTFPAGLLVLGIALVYISEQRKRNNTK
ncbi:S8 family serine peptidase [Erysipelothrix sp. HDW6C]|uniref:S8 family serine peptidase n=1 Tax=Erysipelothrix sp. HDW6C TaxID=2714930 RepID=UPI001407A206|nr:S8 family serine peptidase [Erysipelothrix sp. HDW6C]QIK68843.1 S8 family serine peptidase [Erysipelothrix sp. HDW6C]